MALSIGDGPNRGKSAPPPKFRPLKPKPADDGPRASRPRTSERPAAPRPAAPSRQAQQQFFQVSPQKSPLLVALDRGPSTVTLGSAPKALSVEVAPTEEDVDLLHPPALPPRSKEAVQQYNRDAAAPALRRAQVDAVADMYNMKAKVARRDQMRMDREARDRSETDQVLTAKQWAALSPMQQAAAQANFDLSEAVAKDFKTQGKHHADDAQFKSHQDRVAWLFGEDGAVGYKGLEYAPNTLAFLDSRGIDKAELAGRTLDDLVSGDALVDMDTLKNLHEKVQPGKDIFHPNPDARGRNIAFAQSLAKGQLQYQEDLAAKLKHGDQLLTDMTGRSTGATATTSYGAQETVDRAVLSNVRPETLAQFDMYMEALARSDSPIDKALEAISLDLSQRGATKQEASQVWEGLIERSRQATSGEGKWFDGVDFPMRSPVEVAQALGAPTLKRAALGGAQ